jgi:2-hydroxy-3-keto-5-methylthiopentenyl-1-phosphate phosphatase
MHVFCDFDGTITQVDTTDRVLSRLAAAGWEALESDWRAGRIDAAACMRGQIALIEGSDADLDRVLDEVELADGFVDFVDWCDVHGIAFSVVSDGVDHFIRRILRRHGLARLPVVSNVLVGGPGARRLAQPHRRDGCAAGSGVCKCAATAQPAGQPAGQPRRRTLVYIGDGRSDFCVSARADLLFAKSDLAAYAAGRAQPHHPFTSFSEIGAVLAGIVEARRIAAQ